jgi:hypothetical protein
VCKFDEELDNKKTEGKKKKKTRENSERVVMYNWLDIKKIDLFEKPINPTQIFFFLWIMFGQRRKKKEFLSWLSLIMLLPRKGQS